MIIDLCALGGRSRSVEFLVSETDLDLGIEHAQLGGPVNFIGEVSGDGFRSKVSGKADANFKIECIRCLEPVSYPLSIDFTAEFVAKEYFGSEGEHEIDPKNLTANALDDDHLDLIEVVREQVLLNLPEQVFCREDCKGLCEVCGFDRNLQDCDCSVSEVDPRWSALKNLK